MEKNQEEACPICGRPLSCFDGGVGKCPRHSWMPISPEFEERALELKRKEIERRLIRSEYEDRVLYCSSEPRRSILPLVIAAAIAVVILAVLIFLLFLR